jgi:hypothetical protein
LLGDGVVLLCGEQFSVVREEGWRELCEIVGEVEVGMELAWQERSVVVVESV